MRPVEGGMLILRDERARHTVDTRSVIEYAGTGVGARVP